MAVEKQTKKAKKMLNDVDWLSLGIKVATTAGVAVVTGFLGAAGQDLYQSRKAIKSKNSGESNLVLLDSKRSA